MSPFLVLVIVFVVLLAVRMPVAFAIAMASFAGFAFIPDPWGAKQPFALLTDMTGGMRQLALIAIPFFILAGKIMGRGGVAGRLIGFSQSLIGWLPGGTAYVNVLSSMFFGGVSGSAVADVSSIGSLLVPVMKEEGYDAPFANAVTVSSSTVGLVIPPSNTMILYTVVAAGTVAAAGTAYEDVQLGIDTMFLSGFLPGVAVGVGLLVLCLVLALRRGYPRGRWRGVGHVVRTGLVASPAIGIVVVILGGILFGVVTAEESAALAVVLAIIAGTMLYREMRLSDLPAVLVDAMVTTGVVFFLIASSNAMKYIFAYEDIDRRLLELATSLTDNRYAFLLVLNVVLLVFGTFLDMTPAVLIFTPLFLPVAVEYGVHPIHFGIILLVNLCIGLCTPPVGNCLFVGCSVSKVGLTQMIRPMLPFYLTMILVLLAVTYFEPLTMILPAKWAEWFPATVP